MAAGGTASRALVRLDAEVAHAVGDLDRIVLAFSGGLGSLLVAAVARKRCDVRCVVVGLRGASDLQAARVAQKFLDYPIAVVQPSADRAWRMAQAIRSLHPELPLSEALGMLPMALVEEEHPRDPVLNGFGLTARTPTLRHALGSDAGRSPGLRLRISHSTRAPLLQLAEAAGLPESFARAAPRSPLEGSGIGPALRALARSRKVSFARLFAPDVQRGDYHERRGRRLVPKSSHVDWHL
jgi:hypothetical protein